jgi:signal transduction histidine kinase
VTDFIAHELANPIGIIQGFARMMQSRAGQLSKEDSLTALQSIHQEADRALVILQALLRLAESKTKGVESQVIPLHAVLHRVVARHRQQHPDREITLSGESPLFARANSTCVELALGNLLSNAEKHTPKGRQIDVGLRANGNWSTVSIVDNGPGLPPELYPSLWQIYDQGPEEGIMVSGSGIGLALCKDLAEAMGGKVWAGPNRTGGSVFTVSLPSRGYPGLEPQRGESHTGQTFQPALARGLA